MLLLLLNTLLLLLKKTTTYWAGGPCRMEVSILTFCHTLHVVSWTNIRNTVTIARLTFVLPPEFSCRAFTFTIYTWFKTTTFAGRTCTRPKNKFFFTFSATINTGFWLNNIPTFRTYKITHFSHLLFFWITLQLHT